MASMHFCALVMTAALLGAGCAAPRPVNPAFAVTESDAKRAISEMSEAPRALERPLVIVGGYLDPNVSTTYLRAKVSEFTDDPRVLKVVVGFNSNFEDCRAQLIEAVEKAFPSDDAQWTSEVDVIGTSLGGLVARYAAAPERPDEEGEVKQHKRLRVNRMFTISSPHAGARLTRVATLNQLHRDMKPGSEFMKHLRECDESARYALYPYVCKGDWIVGEEYAAPAGREPLWLARHPIQLGLDPHRGSWYDARILADIFRRLRGEEAFSAAR